jgi:hypothetical protein
MLVVEQPVEVEPGVHFAVVVVQELGVSGDIERGFPTVDAAADVEDVLQSGPAFAVQEHDLGPAFELGDFLPCGVGLVAAAVESRGHRAGVGGRARGSGRSFFFR